MAIMHACPLTESSFKPSVLKKVVNKGKSLIRV